MRHSDPGPVSPPLKRPSAGGSLCPPRRVRGFEARWTRDGFSSRRVRSPGQKLLSCLGARPIKPNAAGLLAGGAVSIKKNRLLFLQFLDLMLTRLKVRILNRSVQVDRVSICFFELIQVQ